MSHAQRSTCKLQPYINMSAHIEHIDGINFTTCKFKQNITLILTHNIFHWNLKPCTCKLVGSFLEESDK